MKKMLFIWIGVICGGGLQAQTWDEWFRQRKTQKDYLVRQIVALKVYLGYVQEGYKIAEAGLTVINHIKNGDFDLHNGFFNALKAVNPAIRNSAMVADIIALQLQVVKQGRGVVNMLRQSEQFTHDELVYVKGVIDRLLEDCVTSLSELITIITPGECEMTDDGRIKRIELLREEMEEKYRFCRSFTEEARTIALQRLTERREVQRSRKLFGLH